MGLAPHHGKSLLRVQHLHRHPNGAPAGRTVPEYLDGLFALGDVRAAAAVDGVERAVQLHILRPVHGEQLLHQPVGKQAFQITPQIRQGFNARVVHPAVDLLPHGSLVVTVQRHGRNLEPAPGLLPPSRRPPGWPRPQAHPPRTRGWRLEPGSGSEVGRVWGRAPPPPAWGRAYAGVGSPPPKEWGCPGWSG